MYDQDKTVDIAVRLSPKRLDNVAPVLEKIVREIVDERQKGSSSQTLLEKPHYDLVFCYNINIISTHIVQVIKTSLVTIPFSHFLSLSLQPNSEA